MAKFAVESANRQNRLRPGGGVKTVYVVWLRSGQGATGQVEISEDVWESDQLGETLQAEAAKLDRAFDVAASL